MTFEACWRCGGERVVAPPPPAAPDSTDRCPACNGSGLAAGFDGTYPAAGGVFMPPPPPNPDSSGADGQAGGG